MFFFNICDQLISSYPKISVCLKLVDFNLNKFYPFNQKHKSWSIGDEFKTQSYK